MRKGTLVFVFGILLILLPYLGIPSDWKEIGQIAIGVILLLVGYAIRRDHYLRTIDQGDGTRVDETFVETTPHLFE
jgi:uncharacterized membrane protein